MTAKTKIAIAIGDPAGIGPEVSLKAALDPAVRTACHPVLFGNATAIERHATACGIELETNVIQRTADADWSGGVVNVVTAAPSKKNEPFSFGVSSGEGGRASLRFASTAIKAALAGEIDAVVAGPHDQKSIALAGIAFDGYPSFVARETGTNEYDVYLMLCFGDSKIVHTTLHTSVRDAIAMITHDKVVRVIGAADRALKRMGVARPMLAVGGLNPHAGLDGQLGREEIEIIKPAIESASGQGFHVKGPIGPDTLFRTQGVDAFIVMLHDHGHLAAKLLAPDSVAAVTIGTPVLFSSVAHGTAYDIAGRGIADPAGIIEAVLRLSRVNKQT
jgi:4-hydroxy-L-threonine phosphate dehydrogenase PdxA